MDISVVVSTFNRQSNLPECVAHLAGQQGVEDIAWELLIVDNNSTDATAETVTRLQREYPLAIRYVFERSQGLSFARNRGIAAARGRYIAFIDDDIRVDPQWLRAIYDGFTTQGCDGVGGRIRVDSPRPIPAWITAEMRGFLGERDFGDEPFMMDGITQFPFGGNMAVSREMAQRVGMFDTRMGRKGEGRRADELFKGEETDFFHRVTAHGGRLYYAPRAAVRHKILEHQLRKRYFRTIHFNAGRQKALLDEQVYPRTCAGVPWFLYRQAALAALRYLRQLVRGGPDRAFRRQMTLGYFVGMIRGYQERRARGRRAAA